MVSSVGLEQQQQNTKTKTKKQFTYILLYFWNLKFLLLLTTTGGWLMRVLFNEWSFPYSKKKKSTIRWVGLWNLYALSSPHITSQQLCEASFIIILLTLQVRQTQNTDNWSPNLYNDYFSPVVSLSRILPTMFLLCSLSHTREDFSFIRDRGKSPAWEPGELGWVLTTALASGVTLDKSVNLF